MKVFLSLKELMLKHELMFINSCTVHYRTSASFFLAIAPAPTPLRCILLTSAPNFTRII